MSSTTEMANLAISNLGIGKEIANLDTEQSEEASACRRYFETAKRATLSDIDWTFATKEAVLNLVGTQPTTEWAYSYRYPVDCLNLRRILSSTRKDDQASRVPFKLTADVAGQLIYADQAEAIVEYTRDVTDPMLFSAEFIIAFSFRLASYIAPRLTGGDPFKIKQEMLGQYQLELGRAKEKNMNQETQDLPPESDLIRARE